MALVPTAIHGRIDQLVGMTILQIFIWSVPQRIVDTKYYTLVNMSEQAQAPARGNDSVANAAPEVKAGSPNDFLKSKLRKYNVCS